MNWHLVSYADENFVEEQKFLHQTYKEGFIHHPYTRKNLVETEFYKENKDLLDQAKGAGWWLWKPYYILETLKSSETNDFIIYSDCGDMFSPGLVPYLEQTLTDDDISLLSDDEKQQLMDSLEDAAANIQKKHDGTSIDKLRAKYRSA